MDRKLNLSTKRLLLRSLQLDDAEAFYSYRSDSQTNQFQGWIPKTIGDTVNFITTKVSTEIDVIGTWHQLVLIEKESQKIIGDIGIHFLDEDKKQVEIGCSLAKKYHGNGYATEALNETIRYLFIDLNKHRITASIDPENKKSIEMLNRLGFHQEAYFRKSILINDIWFDDLVFALLKEDWC